MPDEKPLHVRVAEALGWTVFYEVPVGATPGYFRHLGKPPAWHMEGDRTDVLVPFLDTSWHDTGPLIERFHIHLSHGGRASAKPWGAWSAGQPNPTWWARGDSPLEAVCHLILALAEAGKLS
jgi:hypothetical protein